MRNQNYFSNKFTVIVKNVLEFKKKTNHDEIVDRNIAKRIVCENYNTTNSIENHIVNTYLYYLKNNIKYRNDEIRTMVFIRALSISTINALEKSSAANNYRSTYIFEQVLTIIGENLDEVLTLDSNRKMLITECKRLIDILEEYFVSKPTNTLMNFGNSRLQGLTMNSETLNFHNRVYSKAISKTFSKQITSKDFVVDLTTNIIEHFENELYIINLHEKCGIILKALERQKQYLFDDIVIKIFRRIDKIDEVSYIFNFLNIPFIEFGQQCDAPEGIIPIYSYNEISVCFGYEIRLNVIYLITEILNRIFNSFDIYINYATIPEESRNRIVIGSFISIENTYSNISNPITPLEILNLDYNSLPKSEFLNRYPNTNETESGLCGIIIFENKHRDYEKECGFQYDDGISYNKYGGYNGWSDNAIDDAFEGDPMNTWNVD
jgi:hypothetical protein